MKFTTAFAQLSNVILCKSRDT